jgi:hypothetical protein
MIASPFFGVEFNSKNDGNQGKFVDPCSMML